MTKNKALYAWLNEFMPFYRASSVPDDVEFPYGTYEYIEDAWGGGEVSMTVNLWFHTTSEAVPDEKAQELSRRIGYGGVTSNTNITFSCRTVETIFSSILSFPFPNHNEEITNATPHRHAATTPPIPIRINNFCFSPLVVKRL